MARMFRAIESFSFDKPNGESVVVGNGRVVSENHPGYLHAPNLFEEITAEEMAEREKRAASSVSATETTSAAPGSRRSVTRPEK